MNAKEKEMMMGLDKKTFLNIVLTVAAIGIICSFIGYYGSVGFSWKRFGLFELPLCLFWGWAIMHIIRLANIVFKKEENGEEKCEIPEG